MKSHSDSIFWKVVSGELPLSKAAETLGWQFDRYDELNGVVHVNYRVTGALLNPVGNVQGGLLSAMLDDCMGPAVYLTLPPSKIALTIESKTQFIRTARPGTIRGEGKIEHSKGGLFFTSGKLIDTDGKVIATSSAIFRESKLRWKGLVIPDSIAEGVIRWKLRRIANRL
ncbi:PaaI family thioesterase [Serratia quinivorans]|uniref:PaaI family thioesterase n=1 Tax=Serratia quinivorans TaxID=137545 RepID=UPI0021BD4498|nr:PaaI family thioesterase [Serratia quinivorans]